MQAQRAGIQATDSTTLFPSLWEWKQPAYTNVCTEVLAELAPADAANINLKDYVGYFEAGSTHHANSCNSLVNEHFHLPIHCTFTPLSVAVSHRRNMNAITTFRTRLSHEVPNLNKTLLCEAPCAICHAQAQCSCIWISASTPVHHQSFFGMT